MFTRPKELTITNQATLKMLANKKAVIILQVFSKTPISLKEASRKLNISLSSCFYWVKKFLKTGILTVAKVEKRAGSDIKHYWMAADSLTASLGKSRVTLELYFTTLMSFYGELMLDGILESFDPLDLNLSVKIIANQRGYLSYMLVDNTEPKERKLIDVLLENNAPAVIYGWGSLELKYEDAKEFQTEFHQLVAKYQSKTTRGHRGYFYHVMLAPELG